MKTVIGRRFHLIYTIQSVRKLLVRNGWSCQVPARRAIERYAARWPPKRTSLIGMRSARARRGTLWMRIR
ncbi:winged helix-turn-helix domain-containing protein [Streptomyces sp. NPDC094466]|uniref:winged helix-turn-helix domain-containing protein n=1 Tax=Streptomyces sp. NPDC094466 TaxID=3366065 RepID=UPI0038151CE3